MYYCYAVQQYSHLPTHTLTHVHSLHRCSLHSLHIVNVYRAFTSTCCLVVALCLATLQSIMCVNLRFASRRSLCGRIRCPLLLYRATTAVDNGYGRPQAVLKRHTHGCRCPCCPQPPKDHYFCKDNVLLAVCNLVPTYIYHIRIYHHTCCIYCFTRNATKAFYHAPRENRHDHGYGGFTSPLTRPPPLLALSLPTRCVWCFRCNSTTRTCCAC